MNTVIVKGCKGRKGMREKESDGNVSGQTASNGGTACFVVPEAGLRAQNIPGREASPHWLLPPVLAVAAGGSISDRDSLGWCYVRWR